MDHEAWLQSGMPGADTDAKKAYQYFMRPEPKEGLGPLVVEDDPVTGRKMRTRTARIGMVRNAEDNDKLDVKVYLDPMPHIRLKKAKDLQGWYLNKTTPEENHRPRPCFTDAVLTEPYGGWCTVGCAFSLPAGELVDTPLGPRAIESFRRGDFVLGRSIRGAEIARVLAATRHWKSEGYVRLRLRDGRVLRMTADHPVYSAERETWVNAGDLREGERLENLPRLLRADLARTHRMRSLRSPSSLGERQEDEGTTEPSTRAGEVGGDAQTHERSRALPSRRDGEASERAEESRVSSGASRGRSDRRERISSLEARALRRSEGSPVPDAVGVGTSSCSLDGREGAGLGLRALRPQAPEWTRLPTGLQVGGRPPRRGEGLHEPDLLAEDPRGEVDRLSRPYLGRTGAEEAGHPVVERIEEVPGGCWVYDIETETENFYQQGILVHNCYVNSGFRGYRGSGLITVPLDYGAQVGRQLDKMRTSAAGYFSSFTDPFLPLEDFYHNTQRGAEAFVSRGLPIFFLSRLSYPEWAIDLLTRSKYSYAQKSINTPSAEDWAKLSPGALALDEHLAEISKLRSRGIYVSIQCNPIIAGITTHDDVRHLFGKLAEAGANHVIVKFVEAGYSWAPTMLSNMVARFGEERARRFAELFTCNIGHQKTVDEAYRLEGHKLYRAWATELGLTYATCYEYKFERSPEGEKLSARGISVGRDFLTADQCHGHRVPMFSRESLNEPFKEVAVCPPSGCLSCADDNAGISRCGSELFGAAKALRLPDFKHSVWARNPGLPVAGERPK